MPIQPLSDSTSRILTSTQALNNAVSVVKELVDNALDACAHSISIEIAANSLDKIIVKDDGSGIGVEDRQLLCKRGCTSKIANLDDLANLGGTFLGFRGTALASIAELSKEVTIITKVDGEQPATTMSFGSSGKLLSSASASHNDGTTVRVEYFLVAVPVRKQVVLKNPSKVIDDVKKLLQGYAFARPTVKLSFRVLKAKNDKSNWSFAACKDGNRLLTAAVQIVGKSVADVCRTHSIESEPENGCSAYEIEALLLEADNPYVSETGPVGQYISIDGRPVSHEKGVIKDLVKRYRMYLQQASGLGTTVPSKPFLAVHIRCPEKSYDVNVEPAKDVVLFHNQSKVLDLAERLFAQCYGELERTNAETKQNERKQTRNQSHSSFDILLASKKQSKDNNLTADAEKTGPSENWHRQVENNTPAAALSLIRNLAEVVRHRSPSTDNDLDESEADRDPISTALPKSRHNTCTGDDDFDALALEQSAFDKDLDEEEDYDPKDITINNPFARAKAFAVHRHNAVSNAVHEVGENDARSQVETPSHISPNVRTPSAKEHTPLKSIFHLPTPTTSPFVTNTEPYQNPGPPFPRRNKPSHEDSEISESNRDGLEQVQPPSVQRQTILAGWATSPLSNDHPSRNTVAPDTQDGQSRRQPTLSSPNAQYRSASSSMQRHPQIMNKPFRSPVKNHNLKPVNKNQNILSNAISASQLAPSLMFPESRSTDPQIDDDLQQILDFEYRKKAVNRHRRQVQDTLTPTDLARIQQGSSIAADLAMSRTSQLNPDDFNVHTSITPADIATKFGQPIHALQSPQVKTSNPHQNRFRAAIRHLESPRDERALPRPATDSRVESQSEPATSSIPSIKTADPRGLLISLQNTHSHPNSTKSVIKRAKSSQLPFESIPPSAMNHNTLAIPSNPFPPLETLSETARALAESDPYVKTGTVAPVGWSPTDDNIEVWQLVLQALVQRNYTGETAVDREEEEGNRALSVPHIEIQLAAALKAHIEYNI